MASNLFDQLDEISRGGEAQRPLWAARAPYEPRADHDLMLVPCVKGWREEPEALAALERIEREPWIERVERDGRQVRAVLSAEWIEATGAALAAGEEPAHEDLAAGRRYALNFWDANSTKALHIGHLRNLALGNALGAALTEAGGRVERRSIICDVGRSMGEAMAGVVRSGKHVGAALENGQKSDHFVGACYAEYVKAGPAPAGDADPGDSLSRELDVRDDSADRLLQRVFNGDQEAIELWSKTRAWVISGQRKTLARLGISFDRVFFESDFLPEVAELSNLGLEHGMLSRREDGTVVYLTNRGELSEMPLLRADGLPTQHMRALAYWMAAPGLEGTTSIQICGAEWAAHVTCRRRLMDLMMEKGAGVGFNHPEHDVFHGMVSKQNESVSSSKKGALLIDELAEWIEAALSTGEQRAAVRRGHPLAEAIVPEVALGYFLLYDNTKPLDFEPEKLLREEESLGWDLARARAHNGAGPAGDAPEPARDPDYRFAVVQSEMYRRHLQQAVERLDVSPLAKYAAHLSRWYLAEPRRPHVQAATQAALARAARGLGLEAVR